MGLLIKDDYFTYVRADVLDVIIEQDENFLDAAESASQQEMKSYLNARYDVDVLFRNTQLYSIAATFAAGDFVYLTADDFALGPVYNPNDLVTWTDGNVYKTILLTTGAEDPTNATYFELWGLNKGFYSVINGGAGLKPADALEFTFGDDREPLVVRYLVDLVLYELHSRINPRNIPDLRITRRDDVVDWLKMVANPRNDMSPDFPLKTFDDKQDNTIVWNSNEKRTHSY